MNLAKLGTKRRTGNEYRESRNMERSNKLLNIEEPRELIKKGNQSVRYLFIDLFSKGI